MLSGQHCHNHLIPDIKNSPAYSLRPKPTTYNLTITKQFCSNAASPSGTLSLPLFFNFLSLSLSLSFSLFLSLCFVTLQLRGIETIFLNRPIEYRSTFNLHASINHSSHLCILQYLKFNSPQLSCEWNVVKLLYSNKWMLALWHVQYEMTSVSLYAGWGYTCLGSTAIPYEAVLYT